MWEFLITRLLSGIQLIEKACSLFDEGWLFLEFPLAADDLDFLTSNLVASGELGTLAFLTGV